MSSLHGHIHDYISDGEMMSTTQLMDGIKCCHVADEELVIISLVMSLTAIHFFSNCYASKLHAKEVVETIRCISKYLSRGFIIAHRVRYHSLMR